MCRKASLKKTELNRLIQLIKNTSVNINYKETKLSNSPIVLLCQYNRSESLYPALQALVKREDLSINSTSSRGYNALVFLCRFYPREDLIDCAQLLINRGINVEKKIFDGTNSLQFLCQNYRQRNLIDTALLLINPKTTPFDDITKCIKGLWQDNLRSESKALASIFKRIREGHNPVNNS